jgi:hypothetical protein
VDWGGGGVAGEEEYTHIFRTCLINLICTHKTNR